MAEADPFEEALSSLKQTLVDIDGDGKPDAVVTPQGVRPLDRVASPTDWVTGPNRFALAPQAELRSHTPTVGDDARLGVNRLLESSLGQETANRLGTAAGTLLDYGPIPAKIATDVAMQPVRAGDAVAQAAIDPTLANVTNAGAQTALAVARPAAALGVLGLGYGEAARRDLGIGATPAQAQSKGVALPGLTPEQMTQFNDAVRRIGRSDFRSGAERRMLESTVSDLRGLSARYVEKNADAQRALETQGATSDRQEYDRAVSRADTARDAELARNRRFSDTEVGKVWDQTGGLAPVAAGALTGAASRLATGGGNVLHNYVLPGGLGALAGAAANNVPLAYNAILTEPDNPEKRAYEAYARELPPTHPRKQEFADYAAGLDKENPVRQAASDEFYDPQKFKERALMGGIEGGLAGMVGADVVRIGGRPVSALLGAAKNRGTAAAEPENRLLRAASTRDDAAQRLESAAIDDALPARAGTSGQPSQSVLPPADRQVAAPQERALPAPQSEGVASQSSNTPTVIFREKDPRGHIVHRHPKGSPKGGKYANSPESDKPKPVTGRNRLLDE